MDLLSRLARDFEHVSQLPAGSVISGGSVRDAILGRRPADLDLASPDAPAHAETFAAATGGRRVTLGTKSQTERVIVHGRIYDFSPIQGATIEQDLGRRDFTINAIAIGLDGRLIDPYDGRSDIEAGIVRMVSEDNLVDDPLRILRAPRMVGAFGFEIESGTAGACLRHRDRLGQIAPERITLELQSILAADHGNRAARSLSDLRLDELILGLDLDESDLEAWDELGRHEEGAEERRLLILSMLLATRPPASSSELLDRWTWSRQEVREIDATLEVVRALADDDRTLILTAASAGRVATQRAAKISRVRAIGDWSRLRDILDRAPSPFRIEMLVDGKEIARLTGARGAEIGRRKRALWEAQVLGEVRDRDEAKTFLLGG